MQDNRRHAERFYRAQASDYSRKPIQITIADVVAMFFAGIVVTLLVAFLMEVV